MSMMSELNIEEHQKLEREMAELVSRITLKRAVEALKSVTGGNRPITLTDVQDATLFTEGIDTYCMIETGKTLAQLGDAALEATHTRDGAFSNMDQMSERCTLLELKMKEMEVSVERLKGQTGALMERTTHSGQE